MGTIKIESRGGQNHAVDRDTIALRYRDAFGELPWYENVGRASGACRAVRP
jgi:hypothetical protein